MRRVEGKHFHDLIDRNSGRVISDTEFRNCSFTNCALSVTMTPERRSVARHVHVVNCEERGCAVEAAILDDVTLDGFVTHGLLQCWGTAFRHVTIRGKIGRIMTSPKARSATAGVAEQHAFDEANATFYQTVDWALDIRQAQFEEADLRGIPAGLIRRDPETQVVITRENALKGTWRKVDLGRTHWHTSIELFLKSGASDEVFVAPKRHADFRSLLSGLEALRDADVVS